MKKFAKQQARGQQKQNFGPGQAPMFPMFQRPPPQYMPPPNMMQRPPVMMNQGPPQMMNQGPPQMMNQGPPPPGPPPVIHQQPVGFNQPVIRPPPPGFGGFQPQYRPPPPGFGGPPVYRPPGFGMPPPGHSGFQPVGFQQPMNPFQMRR